MTLLIPGTCFNPSLAIALRAFFSLRECTVTLDPGMTPASPVSTSESELLDASSTSAPFLAGGSSGSSSIRGFDILVKAEVNLLRNISSTYFLKILAEAILQTRLPGADLGANELFAKETF